MGVEHYLPEDLEDLKRHSPDGWADPQTRTVMLPMEQSGILPQMAQRNPELYTRIPDFLVGDKKLLILGGESGSGKSLMLSDLRVMHATLQQTLPPEQQSSLTVIGWDRSHQAFFDEASVHAGETISLPSGETPRVARELISKLMGDQALYTQKYFSPHQRVIIEAPLIDMRGETIFEELKRYKNQMQTFIMHSPRTRYETLEKGRFMKTSGQPDAMMSIRENLLKKILGRNRIDISEEAQEEEIRRWWQAQLSMMQGTLIEWDPEDNRKGFERSVQNFRQLGIKPDVISPKPLSFFTRNQLESIFLTIYDLDDLLKVLIG